MTRSFTNRVCLSLKGSVATFKYISRLQSSPIRYKSLPVLASQADYTTSAQEEIATFHNLQTQEANFHK
jgi:hypothetical protein